MPQNMQASAGYNNLSANEIFFPPSTNVMILQRFWEKGFIPYISNTNFTSGDRCFNRSLKFAREPIIKVRKRQRNGIVKHDQTDMHGFEVFIGDQLEYSYKIDECDYQSMSEEARSRWHSTITNGAAQSAHAFISDEMLHYIIANAACENTGAKAGARTHRYNTGTVTEPLPVRANNATRIQSFANAIFREQNLTREDMASAVGSSALTMLVTPEYSELLYNSDFADRLLSGNCSLGCDMLINGMLPTMIHGFTIIDTMCMPRAIHETSGNEFTYIICMARNAIGFQGIHDKTRVANGEPDGWDVYLQGLMSYGYHMFYPEMVVVFVVEYGDATF